MDGADFLELGFIVGLLIGATTALIICINFASVSLKEFDEATVKCSTNGGIAVIYADGDIVCKNGAEF